MWHWLKSEKYSPFSAIGLTWVLIVTTAIPVALSHGIINFPYKGDNYVACVFLSDFGYSLVWFQVNK